MFASRSLVQALAAGLPRQDHGLLRFHNDEFDEMPCKLNSTENPFSFEKNIQSYLNIFCPLVLSLYSYDDSCISLFLFVCLCLSFSGVVVRVLASSRQELQVEAMEVPTIHRWSIVGPLLIQPVHTYSAEKRVKRPQYLTAKKWLALFLNVEFDVSMQCHPHPDVIFRTACSTILVYVTHYTLSLMIIDP